MKQRVAAGPYGRWPPRQVEPSQPAAGRYGAASYHVAPEEEPLAPSLTRLAALLAAHAPDHGPFHFRAPGLRVVRRSRPTPWARRRRCRRRSASWRRARRP